MGTRSSTMSVLVLTVVVCIMMQSHDLRASHLRSSSSIITCIVSDTSNVDRLVVVEEEPTYDERQLASHVVYPDSAVREGIAGTVIVAVLIGIDGRIEKIQIMESAHEILNKPAINAVRATKFTPAKENGKPVRVWA